MLKSFLFNISQIKKNLQSTFQIIKKTSKNKLLFFINIILILIASLFEVFGVSLLFPILENLISSSNESNYFGNFMISAFNFVGINYNLKSILIVFALIQLLKYFFVLTQLYYSRVLSAEVTKDLREIILNKILKLKYNYITSKKNGDLISSIFVSTQNAGATLENLVILIKSLVYFIFYIIMAFIISYKFTLFLLTLIFISYLIILPFLQKSKVLGEENKKITDEIISNLNNYLKGFKIIKTYNLINKIKNNLYLSFKSYSLNSINIMKNKIFSFSFLEPLILLSIILMIIITYDLATFNLSSFMVILIIFTLLIPQLKSINSNMLQINELIPHYIKLQEILNLVNTDKFNYSLKKLSFKKIVFDNVKINNFGNNNFQLFINYSFFKNKTYAIVGPSGSGKTTIINLILKLCDPDEGNILIDQTQLSQIPIDEWTNNISFVDQENYLFNTTIKENISTVDSTYTDTKFKDVLNIANINIEELDYNKLIGDNSANISGGQRQRISFARAIYKNSDLFILDEFTNELDKKNENIINNYVQSLKGKKTIIIIGHKLDLIKFVDEIIFIKNGKIVCAGNHSDLLTHNKEYRNYFNEN